MGMARRTRRRQAEEHGPSGFLVVDKPVGWTSHDVVDAARGWFSARRIGHLGTLDPNATGVLPLAIRSATKLIEHIADRDKSYAGKVRLGVETDTLDAAGKELARYDGPLPGEAEVRAALSRRKVTSISRASIRGSRARPPSCAVAQRKCFR